jgi:hypothetical protein
MPVIGLNLKSIQAKKHKQIKGAVKVNSNMNMTKIEEQDLPAIKSKGLAIDFEFRTKYLEGNSNKNVAEISIDGDVIFMDDKREEILKNWKKDKTLPEEMKLEVIRVISDKCSKKAILLSDDLQLPPPPLMMPQLRKVEKTK